MTPAKQPQKGSRKRVDSLVDSDKGLIQSSGKTSLKVVEKVKKETENKVKSQAKSALT